MTDLSTNDVELEDTVDSDEPDVLWELRLYVAGQTLKESVKGLFFR